MRALALLALVLVLLTACIDPELPRDPEDPAPVDPPRSAGTGLTGSYFDSDGVFVASRLDPRISFFWERGTSPLSGVPSDHFSVVWTGELEAPVSGAYTFSVFADDGVRVLIEGENVVPDDAWSVWRSGVAASERVFVGEQVLLEEGRYPIRIEFFERDWNAALEVNWTRPDGESGTVPTEYLYPGSPVNEPPENIPNGPTPPDPDPSDPDPVEVDPEYEPEPQDDLPEPNVPHTTVSYVVDQTTDMLNPERGWLAHTSDVQSFPHLRDQGFTVVWVASPGFRLDDYRDRELDDTILDRIDSTFERLREHGLKGKIRFSYSGNPQPLGPDAPESRIHQHLAQLKPLFEKHEDVIAMLDAGFVGKWGEWHASDHGLTANTPEGRAARARINDALLDALPDTRMIGHRYPYLLYELYGSPGYIERDEYFSGSDQSRIGWLNDCFLMGRGNVGTYNTWSTEENFNRDRSIFEEIGRYAVASAETCNAGGGLSEYNTCEASIAEMELLSGPDLLNSAYWVGVYDRWKEPAPGWPNGCYDEITLRLGYRLALRSAQLPTSASPDDTIRVTLDLENTGFGKVYNPRPLELVLVSDSDVRRLRIYDDARWYLPLGGERREISRVLRIPADMPSGTYRMYLSLPDASARLSDDARYAIRLANEDMWIAADSWNGLNDLGATIEIS